MSGKTRVYHRILGLLLVVLAVLPAAACKVDAEFISQTPSDSAEEIARRVGPSVKGMDDYKAEPNYLCYFKNLIPAKSRKNQVLEYPTVAGAPTYRAQRPVRGGWMTATFQVLSTAAEAEQRAEEAKRLASGCSGRAKGSPYGDNDLEAKLSNAVYQENGWRGVRTTSLGEHGDLEYGPLPFGLVSVFASRGPVFAAMTWVEDGSGRRPVAEWLNTGDRAIKQVLRRVGGDPRRAAPQNRDPDTPSAKTAATLLPASDYGYHREDRLDEHPSGGPFRDYSADPVEPPNGVPAVQRSLLSPSVRVEELVVTLPTQSAAQRYYERLPIPGEFAADCRPLGVEKEDGLVARVGTLDTLGFHRRGWDGLISFCAARLSDAPSNAPATDQLAEVMVVARFDNRVAYIYFGSTAAPDLESTVKNRRAVVDRAFDALG